MSTNKNYVDCAVTVRPRSRKSSLIGEYQGRLKISLTAAPSDGKANAALIDFISQLFSVPKRDIEIIRGASTQNKVLRLHGLSNDEFARRLGSVL